MTATSRAAAAAVLASASLLLAGCGSDSSSGADPGEPPTTAAPRPSAAAEPDGPPRVIGTVARGLSVPWGIGFLPNRTALVTERDSGRVLAIRRGAGPRPVGRIDQTAPGSEAGLLGLAVSPDFQDDRLVFVYVSTDTDNRVLAVPYRGGRLGEPEAILTGIPRGEIHDGGRLAFGPDGMLYVSTGETGNPDLAQDRDSLGGKILRITPDGSPAPGNPDPGSPVWSSGHRNVQGLAFDDRGRLWASEFGASSWDELNLIQKGANYGWPLVEGRGDLGGYRNPQVVWRTEDASPSGLAFAQGSLWLASLRGERLWRVELRGNRAVSPTDFFVGDYGRMRAVALAPDGNLWVATSNRDGRGTPAAADDRILLVRP